MIDSADDRVLVDVGEIWAGGPVLDRVWLPIEADTESWFPWATSDGAIPDGFSSGRVWVLAARAAEPAGQGFTHEGHRPQ